MGIKRVVPDITCDAIEESRDFYSGVLGFDVAMDMGWIVTLASPGGAFGADQPRLRDRGCGEADPRHHGRGRRR